MVLRAVMVNAQFCREIRPRMQTGLMVDLLRDA